MSIQVNVAEDKELKALQFKIVEIAKETSVILKSIQQDYKNDQSSVKSKQKEDGSFVCLADTEINSVLTARIEELNTGISIISEESPENWDIPENGLFWAIDPVDNTDGFLDMTDYYFTKISLMSNFQPILAVITQPETYNIYHTRLGAASLMDERNTTREVLRTKPISKKQKLNVIFNTDNYDIKTYQNAFEALKKRNINIPAPQKNPKKSSTAFHMAVAKGDADLMLSYGRSKSLTNGNGYCWDYAADSLLIENAGGAMREIKSGKKMDFSKPLENMNAHFSVGDPRILKP